MNLGYQLRAARKDRQLTLQAVSDATGLSVSGISDIERGNFQPSLDTLNALTSFYDIVIDLNGLGNPPDWKVYDALRMTLASAKQHKPTERGEKARQYAIVITQLEQSVAYFKHWILDNAVCENQSGD